ncbi:N-formylglutamate amidohydrolase [Evansella tamaricis]|uniref:N-formylglutamate amidohydrolase n=1 Tax=Evansella tamaricis TaxID=2069301 RepID=A0ABS6JIP6_9BACI|nr:N-formylglutamate amidohydrolase [Evansella tamaricis]MBU9713549.1 N-formylglutamate amidohydrolase [Evansella tamaricis]
MIDNNKKLPILISVPHGGLTIPSFIRDKCLLSEKDILLDCDTWSNYLYDFKNDVEEFMETDISRIVVDLNRSIDDMPPTNPDGIIKTKTVDGKTVWNTFSGELSEIEIKEIIDRYYKPYHIKLERASNNPHVLLGIDCHTMLDIGPVKNSNSWEKRPIFCLGNRGSLTGEIKHEPISAPSELILKFKSLLEKKFANFISLPLGEDVPLVTINDPFSGGYITKHHGQKGLIPWVQLEINRSLYLPSSDLLSIEPSQLDLARMKEIKTRLYKVFQELIDEFTTTRKKVR